MRKEYVGKNVGYLYKEVKEFIACFLACIGVFFAVLREHTGMAERLSEIVIRSLTLRGWRERVAEVGEEVPVINKSLEIAQMRLVLGMPEGEPLPSRTKFRITSRFQQGDLTGLYVTTTQEADKTYTQASPVLMIPYIRKRRGISQTVGEFMRHGVIAEYVGVRPRRDRGLV